MQACFAVLAVLLAGQVEGDRYSDAATVEPAAERPMFQYTDETPPAEAAAGSNPFRDDAETTPQPTLPTAPVEAPRTPAAGDPYAGGFQPPVTPTADSPLAGEAAGAIKPRDLMVAFLSRPAGADQLQGQTLSLTDAVTGAASRAAQTQLAEAYWDLSAAVADYYLSVRELTELQSLSSTLAAAGPSWRAAESEHQLRLNTALRTAQAAQTRLHGLMGAAASSPLPMPADVPHAGRYDSQYDNIFTDRSNAVAQQLNELLPVEFKNIGNLAAAVGEADQWLSLVSARRSADTTGEGILRAHDLLSLRRREFVDAVRHYNHHIAEYSELATPGRVEPQRAVAMWIKTSASSAHWSDPAVQPAAAVEPEIAHENPASPPAAIELAPVPSTYALPAAPAAGNDAAAQAGFRSPAQPTYARRPILDTLRSREHSILRRPFVRLRGERR